MLAIMNIAMLGLLAGSIAGAVLWSVTGWAFLALAGLSLGIGVVRGKLGRRRILP